jgi:hypothetical protein
MKTSQQGWLAALAKHYKEQSPAIVIDDANVGINPADHTLFDMARKADLSTAEITAVCVACGMGFAGIGMVLLAFVDPEPTSKLALLIGSGVVLALTGGMSAIYVLSKRKPPNIKVSTSGFEITWA